MFSARIHRATVTHADLHYVGSITIDADLLQREQVSVVDVTNGARLETYVIEGVRGSGVIGINGAAAHLVRVGDTIIVIAFQSMTDAEARVFRPRVVHVDSGNKTRRLDDQPAAAHMPGVLPPLLARA